MALFESYERRIDKINGVLAQYGIGSVEECRELCKAKGFDPYEIVKGIQPICFENACWAYTVGAAIALKSGVRPLPTPHGRSAKVCSLSASTVLLPRTARWAWATAIWAPCC